MLTFDVWRFPDGETHLPGKMAKKNLRVDGRLTYQYPLYVEGLRRCRSRRVAMDVGAHVGLFSYWMVRDFETVVAIEPVEQHRECWVANVPARPQDQLHACALGAAPGSVQMATTTPSSTGGTYVAGRGPIPMLTLDSFVLEAVDLLKVDCEGYELEVLQGGADTITRCRPVCIVEQRPAQVVRFHHKATDAIRWLHTLGGIVAWTDRRDYVVTFK